MNARILPLSLPLLLVLFPACTAEPTADADAESGSETSLSAGTENGDGDGDAAGDGDGDGDTTTDSNGDGDGDATTDSNGDGDGDTAGDGDGDTSGDGDGDGDTAGDGDGDGDGTGDGDGDGTGDGDGDEEPLSNDPYDELSCEGLAWDQAAADDYLGMMERITLDDAIMQIRTRDCPGGNCGEWAPAEDWTLSYLSYSGGVTTHYTPYLMDMNLVLFDDNGTATLSIQHQSFAAGGYPDDDGALYGFPPEVIAYPHLRAFNEFPLYQNDYDDLDYQVKDGTMVLGEGCARWVADPYGVGDPYEIQHAILFRW